MKTFTVMIQFLVYLHHLNPFLHKAEFLDEKNRSEERQALIDKMVPLWARQSLEVTKSTVETQGLENIPDEPVVFVGNHTSYADIVVLLGYLKEGEAVPLVGKAGLKKVPYIGRWMSVIHCVFLNRHNTRQAVQNIKEATAIVKGGQSLIVFPEGTRTKTGQLNPFLSGAFKIAQKSKVKVVPFCIKNADKISKPGSFSINSAHVILKVLPTIDTTNYTVKEWRALPQLAEEQVRQGLATLAD